MTTTEPLHLEIIGLAESDDHNVLTFPASSLRRLEQRCVDLLKSKRYPEYVAEFIRAVAAFRAGGQPKAATQLMELGNRVVERLVGEHAAPAEKLKSAVTGAENLASMRPVGSGPVPEGAVKATAFIRPPPKLRG
ncbi:MAG: hypothetical protein KC933_10305 [Myxococcales bacterium]|nr:hypothetical protein [Myxococcales bacterium]